MKRLLYIWKGRYPWEVRIEKVTKAMSDEGLETHVLARQYDDEADNELYGNVHIHRVGKGINNLKLLPVPKNSYWQRLIENAIQELKPDVIIIREFHIAIQAGKAAKKFDLPIIMDMAENYPAAMRGFKKYQDNLLSKFAVNYLKIPEWTEKNSVKLMNGIFVVCDEQVDRLNNTYGFATENMEVVHNTPDLSFFEGYMKGSRKAEKFFHHGNMTGEKRLNNAIKQFAEMKENNVELELAGDGECFNEYEDQIYLKKASKIRLSGRYEHTKLPEMLEKIDIGVIPYETNDFNNYTIHNKIFDFFAMGKPVIVSPTIPFKRLIDETDAGVLCDFEKSGSISEAIDKLMAKGISILSENALKAAKDKYNWSTDKKRLKDFILKYI